MSSRIQKILSKKFKNNRIVFWYDDELGLRDEFEALDMPDVEKLEIKNNEFGLKYMILRERQKDKFLLYHEGPVPDDLNNWLLDLQLANDQLRTDQAAVWLGELGMGAEYTDVIKEYAEFFNAAKRRDALKVKLNPGVTKGQMKLDMLSVCASSDTRLDDILENLLEELSTDRDRKMELIVRCGLDRFLWEQLGRFYEYRSEKKGIKDFAIELFKSCYAMEIGGKPELSGEALIFLKRWKDSIKKHESFEKLSFECAKILNIEKDIEQRNYEELIELDYFKIIDKKILSGLVKQVTERTISVGDCEMLIRERRQGHWYKEYSHLYEAVGCASRFIAIMSKASFSVESLAHGIEAYRKTWFEIDQLYRKYIYHVKSSAQSTLMNKLSENIENLYSNEFLLKVNDNFQQIIDRIDTWEAVPVKSQRDFFSQWAKPYLEHGKKVYVIISDALRYEIGCELVTRIIQEDRFEANIEPALSMIPSYTQLGIGALFPNRELAIGEDTSATVFVDGRNSKGSVNRGKILKNGIKQKSKVMSADDLLKLNNDESRELIRVNDIIYFYHNRIDAMGGRETEERVFEAAERAIEELITIVKKLTSANANNILITADHGFIYQDREIDTSDFTEPVDNGGDVFVRDRRYIIGKNLVEHSSLKKFKSKEVGLVGDVEIQIPKSINRLRKKGTGSRYVHGGASMQEVIIPIIHVNKKRESDISRVEIDIINGAKRTISSGQFTVVFYQKEPVKGKKQPIELHAGLYTKKNELISDEHTLVFDYTSENPREREYKVRFVLSRQAEKVNNQDVILKLEEQVPGTSHRREYKTARYLLRRSFMSDFDF